MTESISQVYASLAPDASTTRRVRGQTWRFTRPQNIGGQGDFARDTLAQSEPGTSLAPQNLSAAGNPAVTAPSVCQTCYGDQVIPYPNAPRPCTDCCCEFCGQSTDTPPECASCQIAEDVAATRRSG